MNIRFCLVFSNIYTIPFVFYSVSRLILSSSLLVLLYKFPVTVEAKNYIETFDPSAWGKFNLKL